MDEGAPKMDLPIVIKAAPSYLWFMTAILAGPLVMSVWTFIAADEMSDHFEVMFLSVNMAYACMWGVFVLGMESSRLVLTEEQIYYRSFFSVRRIPLQKITGTKMDGKYHQRRYLTVTVLDASGHQDVALGIAMYYPKECEHLLKALKRRAGPRRYLLKVLRMRSVMGE